MDSRELADQITDVIVDKQGEDVVILDLQEVTTVADYFIICSGTSSRQLDALQYAITEQMKGGEERILPRNVEGDPSSGWVLVDYNAVVVHIFDPEVREFYALEDLWKNGRVIAHIQ